MCTCEINLCLDFLLKSHFKNETIECEIPVMENNDSKTSLKAYFRNINNSSFKPWMNVKLFF